MKVRGFVGRIFFEAFPVVWPKIDECWLFASTSVVVYFYIIKLVRTAVKKKGPGLSTLSQRLTVCVKLISRPSNTGLK